MQQVAINNTQSGQPIGFRRYTYESGKLKTYAETNAQNVALQTYTFDGAGKLVGYNELGVTATIDNGKNHEENTAKWCDNRLPVRHGKGQLLSEVIATDSIQTVRTYSYDQKTLLEQKPSFSFGVIPSS